VEFDVFRLAASTASLDEEPAARARADLLEFRLDLATAGVGGLTAYDGDLPVLVTNRVEGEGGAAPEGPARLDALERAVEYDPVVAIDVELAAIRGGDGRRVVKRAREHGTAVVVSVHDFEATPGRGRMRSLLRAAGDHGDVAKLAVTATDRGDVLDLLAVTDGADGRVATVAMGEAGRHSRAVAPLYGSRIGYAPVDPADATAPGQYDLATLRTLVDGLRGRPTQNTK